MDLHAQILEPDLFVARVLGDELRHHPPQRLVSIVVVLELLQLGHHGVPAALGDADGEHDEEGVEAGLLDHDAVLGEVLGEHACRDAPVGKVAVHIQARRDHRGLDRVEHVEAFGQLAETMPALAGTQRPVFAQGHAVLGEVIRPPDLEPPVRAAELLVHLAHGAAEIQRLADRLLDQCGARRGLHHRRRHIATGDDRVLRRCRGVHEVGFIEAVIVERPCPGVLHQHLGSLRQAGQQLVGGLGGEHHRVLAARPVCTDRVVVAVELVESRMRQPGFVEVQGVDAPVEQVLDLFDVVQHAVVGALGDRQHPRLGGLVLDEGVGVDLALDVLPLELALRNRADDAEVVAGRHQEYRDRPGHDDGVENRLVAVAVDHHGIARRYRGMPDDLVRGGGAVGDEEQVVGVEDARRVALRGVHRAGMVEQLAELVDRVADVGTQHVLAEELVEHLSHRALEEGDTARVAGAVPGIGPVGRVVGQRAEEWRRQAVEVGLGLAHHVARDELRRILEHVNETMQLAQYFVGDMARGTRFAMQEDRDIGVAMPDLVHEVLEVGNRLGRGIGRGELLVVDRQDEGRTAALLLGKGGQVAITGDPEHLHALILDGFRKRTDSQPRSVLGAKILVDDDDRKVKPHARLRSGSTDPATIQSRKRSGPP